MKIREAKKDDLKRLLELYREPGELYPEFHREDGDAEERFAEVLADAHQETLVAEDGGEVVGTLVVVIVPNLAYGGAPYAVVENVVVAGDRCGEGVGKALMREAVERARAAGAYKLALTTNLQRERAHRFYRALGMEETHLGFEVAL